MEFNISGVSAIRADELVTEMAPIVCADELPEFVKEKIQPMIEEAVRKAVKEEMENPRPLITETIRQALTEVGGKGEQRGKEQVPQDCAVSK